MGAPPDYESMGLYREVEFPLWVQPAVKALQLQHSFSPAVVLQETGKGRRLKVFLQYLILSSSRGESTVEE